MFSGVFIFVMLLLLYVLFVLL